MHQDVPYQQLANVVLLTHVAIVAFVVGGLPLIVAGNLRGWRWVNALSFRLAHLGAVLIVVSESLFGIVYPLTTLEMWLRAQGREPTYAGGFIEHWLQSVLYYHAPAWAFTVAYSLFGLIVVATWWYFPPRYKRDASYD